LLTYENTIFVLIVYNDNFDMYKYIGRVAGGRFGMRAGSRLYSTSFRTQISSNLAKTAVGTTVGIIGLAVALTMNSTTISNEIDPEKLELAKQQAFKKVQEQSASKAGGKADEEKATSGEEESQAAAFNPETGEINWDCPCLGGMAHGPCGEEFKEAFSCFVYSEEEPKGIDCIKKFENMRNCFRQYPEHYKEELYDDDDQSDASAQPAAAEPVETAEVVAEPAASTSEIIEVASEPEPASEPVVESSVPETVEGESTEA
jgi:intermembrane space import and assembly protein 40